MTSSGVDLQFTCQETHLFTLANRERLERAVYNLISNAVKFSEPGTCVEAKLVHHGDLAYLSIENQGEGIANHVRSDLFHRYLREPAIEDSRFGMGLGMTIVRSVAALHGGTVLIDQPKGTRVTMTMQIRKIIPDSFHSPQKRIGLYSGGFDQSLLELSDILPAEDYKK